jgi:hypothetical protein
MCVLLTFAEVWGKLLLPKVLDMEEILTYPMLVSV